jgi:2-methylcitrate dehydratase PrpD
MAWTKRMHPGWAGVGGITAALLAKGGYVGPTLPYEGNNGLFKVYLGTHAARSDISLATRGLNDLWEIDKVAFKPIPACYFSIAAIDAACTLHREHGVRAENIDKVRILVPQAAVETVCMPAAIRRKPTDTYAAVFSVYYGVAVALARGRYGLTDLEPAALADPQVLALIERSEYEIDPHTTFPQFYSGAVRVTLHDGRSFEQREDIHRGAPERPLSESAIIEKFMNNAARSLSGDRPARVCDAVLNLESVANVSTITGLLAPN